MSDEIFKHTPVLLEEVLKGLLVKPDGTYIDATVGGAGHSLKIAEKLTTGKIIAFDKDPDAILAAKKRLKNYNVEFFNADFSNMLEFTSKPVDGILMDLGVSSFQLENEKRGFSYRKDGPLDMRMSKKGRSAKEIVNDSSKEDLVFILKKFGEEKFAERIATKIILERKKAPIDTTAELAEIVKSSIPFKFKRDKNPCKKTFQAIRIAVNNEFFSLKKGLEAAFSLLKPKARLLVISFHSLEDKIVKNFYKQKSVDCICSKKFPVCVCGNKATAKIITKKPIVPSKKEIELNRKAHSAKLRILEKI